jgi:hypothetical protein
MITGFIVDKLHDIYKFAFYNSADEEKILLEELCEFQPCAEFFDDHNLRNSPVPGSSWKDSQVDGMDDAGFQKGTMGRPSHPLFLYVHFFRFFPSPDVQLEAFLFLYTVKDYQEA